MKFFYSLSILTIGATLGLAAPSSEPGLSTSNLRKRQCDSQNADCGVSKLYLRLLQQYNDAYMNQT